MSTLVAIDPGGVHVGVAGFSYGDDPAVCVRAIELNPEQTEDMLWGMCAGAALDRLVIETWRLFPDMAPKLSGSDMPTSQLIGSLRWMARQHGIPVVMQEPTIKLPTISLLRAAMVPLRSVREHKGGHAKDAELHGWCWLVRARRTGLESLTAAKREATTGASAK